MPTTRLLIVDDNQSFASALSRQLRESYVVTMASEKNVAISAIRKGCDLVLLDLRLNDQDDTNRDGMILLRDIHAAYPDLPVIMMTAFGDVETAVEAIHEGAADFLEKGFELAKLRTTLANVIDKARLQKRVTSLEQEIARVEPGDFVGQNAAIEKIRRLIQMVGEKDTTVLIRGETGTGKELVARAIYRQGKRSTRPFIEVVLACIPRELVASELFGHERWIFTGAQERRIGRIEEANGGVLYLNEIGEIPLEVQVNLLRIFDEQKLKRIGGKETIDLDVQFVTATNRNLEEAVQTGQFREDLFYRLKVLEIVIPPLRERAGDISLLVDHFLALFHKQGQRICEMSDEALAALERFHWPGNVRQLKNTLERAITFANLNEHHRVELEDLPPEILGKASEDTPKIDDRPLPEEGISLDLELAKTELVFFEKALQTAKGRKNDAWKLLGLNDRYALHRRLTKILKKYPHLVEGFPMVQRLYKKH